MVNTKRLLFGGLLSFFVVSGIQGAKIGYAANQYRNGQHTIYTNVVTPQADHYIGGWNMANPGAPTPYIGSTSILFNTNANARNNIGAVFGGSIAVANSNAVVQGDTNITLYRTDVILVCGGGMSHRQLTNDVSPSLVTGTSHIKLYDSQVTTVIGGGIGGGNTPAIGEVTVGGVDILVDSSRVDRLYGSGWASGLASQGGDGVLGDVKIAACNNSEIRTLVGTAHTISSPVRGNISFDIRDTQVRTFSPVGRASTTGNVAVYLGRGSVVEVMYLSDGGFMGDTLSCVIDDGRVEKMWLTQRGYCDTDVNIHLKKGVIQELRVSDDRNLFYGKMRNLNCLIEEGTITSLYAGAGYGGAQKFTIDLKEKGRIEHCIIGYENVPKNALVDELFIRVSGGIINTLECKPVGVGHSTVQFMPGQRSTLCEIVKGSPISKVEIAEGAEVQLGRASKGIRLEAKNIDLAGVVFVPEGAPVTFAIGEHLVVDGAQFVFEKIGQDMVSSGPLVIFDGEAVNGLKVKNPLRIDGRTLRQYMGQGNVIPIVEVKAPNLVNRKLISPVRKGLVWADVLFDENTNIWSIENVRASEGYYGYTTGRKTSSWLRRQGMYVLQNHGIGDVLERAEGLWMNGQGGYEEFTTPMNMKASNMAWGNVTLGYSHHRELGMNLSGIFGGAAGVSKGWNEWEDVERVTNRTQMFLVGGYAGCEYNGIYSVATLQVGMGITKSNNPYFGTNKKWSEFVPMQGLELGWKYEMMEGLKVIPRAKVLFEEIAGQSIDFEIEELQEKVALKSSINVNTVVGIGVVYNAKEHTEIDMDMHCGLDWIKGWNGHYEAYSQLFTRGFKEENDDSIIRVSLGGKYPVVESLNLGCSVFVDMLDNKGFGGEVTVEYGF